MHFHWILKRFRDSEKTERKRYTGVHFWRVFAKSAPQKSLFLRTRMQVAGIGPSRGIARGRARSGFVALGVEE